MRTLDHLFARRVSRRTAVQLLGAAPVLAHQALAAGPTALCSPQSPPPATTAAADRLFEAGQFVAADAAYRQILAHDPLTPRVKGRRQPTLAQAPGRPPDRLGHAHRA